MSGLAEFTSFSVRARGCRVTTRNPTAKAFQKYQCDMPNLGISSPPQRGEAFPRRSAREMDTRALAGDQAAACFLSQL